MLEFLKDYAHLINFALFGTIIGWLFHISRLSRTSLIDKYDAQLATKDQELTNARLALESAQQQYESQIAVIDHSRQFFERLATLSDDERLAALKLEYEMRLESLERREATVAEAARKAELQEEKAELEAEAKKVLSVDAETLSKMLDIATKVASFSLRI